MTPSSAGPRRPMPLTGTTMCPDPAAVFDRLRTEHGPVAPVELESGVPAWLVMGYEELRTVTEQEHLFSRDARNWRAVQEGVVPPDSPLGPMMFFRDNVIGYDGAEHRRLRRPLEDAVAAIDHRRLRRDTQARCNELIDGFHTRAEADLVTEYAALVPGLAICGLFGLNPSRALELLAALQDLFSSGPAAQDGDRRLRELLAPAIEARRLTPADDLTGLLARHPSLRTNEEVLQSIIVMVSAGGHTTTSWIAHTLVTMVTDPRFAGRLRGGSLGIDDALNEVLWREPPMTNMPARYALRNCELSGTTIRRGDALILGLAAAARDPRIHTPRSMHDLLARGGNRAHFAWSAGPHACPARDPARTITRTAVHTVLHRLGRIHLQVPVHALTAQPSPWTRCPASLPVRFSASVPATTTIL